MSSGETPKRTKLFISKATRGDDQFALWIAPRLEAAGYEVFTDIGTGYRRSLAIQADNNSSGRSREDVAMLQQW